MVFHWRLSDSKSPQVSRTLLSIRAVFNNAVVWMVSTRLPTSKSSRPFNKPFVTVPKAPITIGIIIIIIWKKKILTKAYRQEHSKYRNIWLQKMYRSLGTFKYLKPQPSSSWNLIRVYLFFSLPSFPLSYDYIFSRLILSIYAPFMNQCSLLTRQIAANPERTEKWLVNIGIICNFPTITEAD